MYHKLELNDVWFLRYEVWQNALVIWGHFLPFYSTNNPKNQNFEKMKKQTWRYHHFTQAYQKSWPYAILFLDMTYDKCKCYFSFWAIFCPFTPLTAQKIKMKKMKKVQRYHPFTQVYQKLWSDDVWFLWYGAQQMEGWTDRRKKWHIKVGAHLKKILHY